MVHLELGKTVKYHYHSSTASFDNLFAALHNPCVVDITGMASMCGFFVCDYALSFALDSLEDIVLYVLWTFLAKQKI